MSDATLGDAESSSPLGDAEVLKRKAGTCEAALPFLEATLNELRLAASALLEECKGGDSSVGRSTISLLHTVDSLELAFAQAEQYVQELNNLPAYEIEQAVGSIY